jgi:integrase/recombinase XerD
VLVELFPRIHARFSSLPLLGPHVDDFVIWLHARGHARLPIYRRIREAPRVDKGLRRRGVRSLNQVSRLQLLKLAPQDSQDDIYLAVLVRSLADYLDEQGALADPVKTASQELVDAYRDYLDRVRGFAKMTLAHHASSAAEFLTFLGYEADPGVLRRLKPRKLEAFIKAVAPRVCRESLQHTVAHLRSFLRFLVGRDALADGLGAAIDMPRVYRGERLPRSLPWETVQAFLAAIDRSTPMGRRDYAMFLLITTYGLRTSEVAALRLDDIEWRAGRLSVPRPKVKTPIVLPLTKEVGAAIIEYLRRGRPDLPHREVFLRVRSPAGTLKPTAVTEAFQGWTRRAGLPIPYQGPHCLRHSLAIHLLRRGTSIKAIGDLLGHRSAEATCVYLRLNLADLRGAALEVPSGGRS